MNLKSNIKKYYTIARDYIKANKVLSGCFIAVVLVLVAILLIFFSPDKRADRAIKKADQYLEMGQPESAATYYRKAVNIAPTSTKAYYGLVYSELSYGDKVAAITDFDNARVSFYKYTEAMREKEKNYLIDAYLLVPELYENVEARLQLLNEVYDYTNESDELKPILSDTYLEYARILKEEDPETALWYYEKVMELRNGDANIAPEIAEIVSLSVDQLRSFDRFEEAYELLEKYKDYMGDTYDSLKQSVSESEELFEKKAEMLKKIYEEMETYYFDNKDNWQESALSEDANTGIFTKDWTNLLFYDDAVAFIVETFSDSEYFYAPDGFTKDYTGIGCGIYTYGNVVTDAEEKNHISYYFYFGEYVNGKREGYGYSFIKSGESSYLAYEGQWSSDKPNGTGVLYESERYAYTSLDKYKIKTVGNWTDGLANGSMQKYAFVDQLPDTSFVGEEVVKNGVAEEIPAETEEYYVDVTASEGKYLVGILKSVKDGFDVFLPVMAKRDTLFGIFGF